MPHTLDLPLGPAAELSPFLMGEPGFLVYPGGSVARVGPDVPCDALANPPAPSRISGRVRGIPEHAEEVWVDLCGIPVEVSTGGAFEAAVPPGPCSLTPWVVVLGGTHGVQGASLAVVAAPGETVNVVLDAPSGLYFFGFLPSPDLTRVLAVYRGRCVVPPGLAAGVDILTVDGAPPSAHDQAGQAGLFFRQVADDLVLGTSEGTFRLRACPWSSEALRITDKEQRRNLDDRIRRGAVSDEEVRLLEALLRGEGWQMEMPRVDQDP
jgi:hypothetical protein